MPDDELHGCHQCGSPIMWCVSTNGKRMPIDVAPTPEGAYVKLKLEWDGEAWQKIVAYVPEFEREWMKSPLYTCHFETCYAKKARDD